MLAARVSESWGQRIVVENRAGGGQIIAAEIIARATPDGYSLLQCGVVTMAINPALYRKLSYHPLRDFAPVTSIATPPNVLVIHPSVPAKTAKEFIAHVLAHPGSQPSDPAPRIALQRWLAHAERRSVARLQC